MKHRLKIIEKSLEALNAEIICSEGHSKHSYRALENARRMIEELKELKINLET